MYIAKAARVYVSGLMSVMVPAYLRALGYSGFFVGVVLAAILAGNAVSNLVLTYLDRSFGRKRILLGFSLLMAGAGVLLFASSLWWAILIGCFVGNISTTGTEAGPFQSVEAGVLPDLVGEERAGRAFGTYNLIGYTASALGAFTLYVPGSQGDSIMVFRTLFLLFGAVGLLLALLYSGLRNLDARAAMSRKDLSAISGPVRKDVLTLSALFSVDAFGGSFVSQFLLSYWFSLTFNVPDTGLATIFLTTNVIAAASTYVAARLGGRFGNLRTMVLTHAASSLFLLLVGLSGTLALAVGFLFLRQSMSQMDVPTRQALMAEMFASGDRVPAYAVTNTARGAGSFVGGPASALILGAGVPVALIYSGGLSKLLYDLLIYMKYRRRYR